MHDKNSIFYRKLGPNERPRLGDQARLAPDEDWTAIDDLAVLPDNVEVRRPIRFASPTTRYLDVGETYTMTDLSVDTGDLIPEDLAGDVNWQPSENQIVRRVDTGDIVKDLPIAGPNAFRSEAEDG